MQLFLAQLINGLCIGGVYALLVLGMNLLMLVRNVVHHSFSHITVLNMGVGWLIFSRTGSAPLAFVAMLVCGILLTVCTEPLFRPLSKRGADLETVTLAMGIGIILTELIGHVFNRGQVMSFSKEMRLFNQTFSSGAITFSVGNIISLAASVLIAVFLVWFLFKTSEGRAMRAMAQNLRVAKMLGVPFGRTGIMGFSIAGLLSACIAIICIMCLGYANSELGDMLAVKAIILMLFAGSGDIKGGIMSAILMGVVESMAMSYLPGRWTEAIFYGFIMIVIIIKPRGLFSKKTKA